MHNRLEMHPNILTFAMKYIIYYIYYTLQYVYFNINIYTNGTVVNEVCLVVSLVSGTVIFTFPILYIVNSILNSTFSMSDPLLRSCQKYYICMYICKSTREPWPSGNTLAW